MRLKTCGTVVYVVTIGTLLVIAAVVAMSALPIPGGIKLFTVQSGSMEPAINTGSVVVVKPQSEYRLNDIITFKDKKDIANKQPATTTTHRVHDIKQTEMGIMYQSKGDANSAPDGEFVSPDLVIGKVIISIPLIGFPVSFARTQTGLLVLIVIPSTLIVYSELMNIKKEISLLLIKRKEKQQQEL